MSTVNGRVNGKSEYFTAAPGNKASGKFWGGGFGVGNTKEKNTGAFKNKDPGLREQRNDVKKKHDCPFCG